MKNRICQFEKRVNALRLNLNNSINGKTPGADFYRELEKLKKEEREILENSIEDFNKIEFEKCRIKVNVREILKNADEINRVNSLSEEEREKIQKLMENPDYENVDDENITAFYENEDCFIAGYSNGDIKISGTEDRKFHIFSSEVINIERTLHGETVATSADGRAAVINDEIRLYEFNEIIFKTASDSSNILLLGESGNVYLLKRFKNGYEKYKVPVLTDYVAVNIVNLKENAFLALKIEDNVETVEIESIVNAVELWNKPLFRNE